MILCLDVHYFADHVATAALGLASWSDEAPVLEEVHRVEGAPAPYVPGSFYLRELPHLLAVVEALRRRVALDVVVVDAHAWLDGGRPGLGAHLHQALGGALPVVGVAKNAFRGSPGVPVQRGESHKPLWVSAAGMDGATAAAAVAGMHGDHRLPTALKRVDHLARGLAPPSTTS